MRLVILLFHVFLPVLRAMLPDWLPSAGMSNNPSFLQLPQQQQGFSNMPMPMQLPLIQNNGIQNPFMQIQNPMMQPQNFMMGQQDNGAPKNNFLPPMLSLNPNGGSTPIIDGVMNNAGGASMIDGQMIGPSMDGGMGGMGTPMGAPIGAMSPSGSPPGTLLHFIEGIAHLLNSTVRREKEEEPKKEVMLTGGWKRAGELPSLDDTEGLNQVDRLITESHDALRNSYQTTTRPIPYLESRNIYTDQPRQTPRYMHPVARLVNSLQTPTFMFRIGDLLEGAKKFLPPSYPVVSWDEGSERVWNPERSQAAKAPVTPIDTRTTNTEKDQTPKSEEESKSDDDTLIGLYKSGRWKKINWGRKLLGIDDLPTAKEGNAIAQLLGEYKS